MKLLKNTRIRIAIVIIILILIATLLSIQFWVVDLNSKPTREIREMCDIQEKYYENRKVFSITPKEGIRNDKIILYFHGGSYVAEMSEKHWKFVKDLVKDTGSTLILPDYPLTPKYDYKDVFQKMAPLYKKIIEKVGKERLIVLGDSAGGGMALALCESVAEQTVELPNKLLLVSPWLDVTLTNEKIEEVQKKDKQLNKDALKMAGKVYAGEEGIDTYLVNPINGPLEVLKNMEIIVYTGTYDILNPDVAVLEQKAKDKQIEIKVKEYEEQEHIWLLERGKTKTEEAEEAYQDLIKEILLPEIRNV